MDSPAKPQQRRLSAAKAAAPDGGYAWFILLSAFVVFGLTFGVIKAFGAFYVEIHQYFETTAAGTSWITSIAVAAIHIVAPISSALNTRYGSRSVVIVGGLICSVGVAIGSFSRTLVELYLTVGFLNGFGYALTWTPTMTLLGLYFDKKRPVANALASSGECILTFILTPLFQLLIDCYSWRGALQILGALQLNLCVCGMLLRPLKHTKDVSCDGGDDGGAEEEGLMLEDLDRRREEASDTKPSEGDGARQRRSLESLEDKPNEPARTKGEELKAKIRRYVDYTLITNARFMVYSMFGVFAALGFFAPGLFLIPYARSKGIEEYQAAALMSISAVLDLFGRVFFGWVANLRLVETVNQLTVTVILLGTVLLLCPLASTFLELAVFSAAYGLVYGATVAIHITVLAEVVGVQRLGSALGFFMLIRSSGGLFGPPIAGFFIDKMSDYGTGFLMAGVALIVSAMFLLLLSQMNRRRRSQSQGAAGKRPTCSWTKSNASSELKANDTT
ncbi:unnamed protein product [Ophioblennius macclurei]